MLLALISAFEIKPVSWIKKKLEKCILKISIYSLCILFQSCRKTQLALQLFLNALIVVSVVVGAMDCLEKG